MRRETDECLTVDTSLPVNLFLHTFFCSEFCNISECMAYMNKLVLCVKLLVAALPVAVCFIYGLLFRLTVFFVQVISAIQQTQEWVLDKYMGTDSLWHKHDKILHKCIHLKARCWLIFVLHSIPDLM